MRWKLMTCKTHLGRFRMTPQRRDRSSTSNS